jgi:SAM-dependent methyltransferase
MKKRLVAIGALLIVTLSIGYVKREGLFNFLVRKHHIIYYQEPESVLAHFYLDGLKGLEIGASAHNPFGLKTLNVDYSDDYTTVYKQEEIRATGQYAPVNIVASGDKLPIESDSQDFVISSHVIEHFYDPISAVKEWLRVVRPSGYVYIIAPHKERTFDRDRPRTALSELLERHEFPNPPVPDHHGHYSVWITKDFLELCDHFKWKVVAVQDVDDKIGNGFTIVLQK